MFLAFFSWRSNIMIVAIHIIPFINKRKYCDVDYIQVYIYIIKSYHTVKNLEIWMCNKVKKLKQLKLQWNKNNIWLKKHLLLAINDNQLSKDWQNHKFVNHIWYIYIYTILHELHACTFSNNENILEIWIRDRKIIRLYKTFTTCYKRIKPNI